MADKTHWKKIVAESDYLGEADFQEGEEKVATIAHVNPEEEVQTAEGKSKKAVVHFAEDLKPMILNVARSKAIEKVAGSPYFEDWRGVPIQLYIEHGIKAFGDVVSAVRVRPRRPAIKQAVKCEDCGRDITGASGKSAEYIAKYTKHNYGVALCFECATNRAEQKKAESDGAEVKQDATTETDG